jgi:hypothetical protein
VYFLILICEDAEVEPAPILDPGSLRYVVSPRPHPLSSWAKLLSLSLLWLSLVEKWGRGCWISRLFRKTLSLLMENIKKY